MEWSFGDSWIVDLFALVADKPLMLFLTDRFSTELELDDCNWFDFGVSENVEFGFCVGKQWKHFYVYFCSGEMYFDFNNG